MINLWNMPEICTKACKSNYLFLKCSIHKFRLTTTGWSPRSWTDYCQNINLLVWPPPLTDLTGPLSIWCLSFTTLVALYTQQVWSFTFIQNDTFRAQDWSGCSMKQHVRQCFSLFDRMLWRWLFFYLLTPNKLYYFNLVVYCIMPSDREVLISFFTIMNFRSLSSSSQHCT